MLINKKAQSIIEYTIMLAVIVGAIVWIVMRGGIGDNVKKAYDKSTNALDNAGKSINFGNFSTT